MSCLTPYIYVLHLVMCGQEELPAQEDLKLVGKAGFMPYKATAELIQRSING